MSGKVVKVNNQNVAIKDFNGQRVVTFKDIDTVHERADGTARKRFNDNKNHFVEGEDFSQVFYTESVFICFILPCFNPAVRNSDTWY